MQTVREDDMKVFRAKLLADLSWMAGPYGCELVIHDSCYGYIVFVQDDNTLRTYFSMRLDFFLQAFRATFVLPGEKLNGPNPYNGTIYIPDRKFDVLIDDFPAVEKFLDAFAVHMKETTKSKKRK